MNTSDRIRHSRYLQDIDTLTHIRQQQIHVNNMLSSLLEEQRHLREQYIITSERLREHIDEQLNDRSQIHIFALPSNFFENRVHVAPTQEQINNATERVIFETIRENVPYTTCPIDHVDFEPDEEIIRIRHCGHIFRHSNLMRWFRENVRCPVCRHDIREE
jgi:hypothetical protein